MMIVGVSDLVLFNKFNIGIQCKNSDTVFPSGLIWGVLRAVVPKRCVGRDHEVCREIKTKYLN
jgi:hypothetical protein